MDGKARGLLLVTVSAVSFGGVAVLTQMLLSSGLQVLPLAFWRWVVACAALLPLAWSRVRRVRPRAALAAFALGAIGQAGTTGFYTASLQHIPAALGSFLLFLNPVIVSMLSAVLLRESLGVRGSVALGVSVAGLALLAFAPDVDASMLGVGFALLAAFMYAGVIVTGRRLTDSTDPLGVAFLLAAGSVLSFGVGAWVTGTWALPAGGRDWALLVTLGVVSTALSIATFYAALPLIGASRAALVSTLEPVSTAVLACIVLGQGMTLRQIGGALLILAAVVLLALERAVPPIPPEA